MGVMRKRNVLVGPMLISVVSLIVLTFMSSVFADTPQYTGDCQYSNFKSTAIAMALPSCGGSGKTVICRVDVTCSGLYKVSVDGTKTLVGKDISGSSVCHGVMVSGKPSCDTSANGANQCAGDATVNEMNGFEAHWASGGQGQDGQGDQQGGTNGAGTAGAPQGQTAPAADQGAGGR